MSQSQNLNSPFLSETLILTDGFTDEIILRNIFSLSGEIRRNGYLLPFFNLTSSLFNETALEARGQYDLFIDSIEEMLISPLLRNHVLIRSFPSEITYLVPNHIIARRKNRKQNISIPMIILTEGPEIYSFIREYKEIPITPKTRNESTTLILDLK